MIQITEITEGQEHTAFFKPEHVVAVRVGNKSQGSVITLSGGAQLKCRLKPDEVLTLIAESQDGEPNEIADAISHLAEAMSKQNAKSK